MLSPFVTSGPESYNNETLGGLNTYYVQNFFLRSGMMTSYQVGITSLGLRRDFF